MGKKSKIKPTKLDISSTNIVRTEINDTEVSFNFKRLFQKNNKFRYDNRESRYFIKLLERLKNVSGMTRIGLRQCQGLHFHQINFRSRDVSEDSFGLGQDIDNDAWQISISVNEHGRIVGYFVANTFYVVWLDPEHELCPKNA